MAWRRGPTGVAEQGMYARIAQEPGRSRRLCEKALSAGEATKSVERGVEKSEHLHRTSESGEPCPRDPEEGERVPSYGVRRRERWRDNRARQVSQRDSDG
jgi:hypothetical protein